MIPQLLSFVGPKFTCRRGETGSAPSSELQRMRTAGTLLTLPGAKRNSGRRGSAWVGVWPWGPRVPAACAHLCLLSLPRPPEVLGLLVFGILGAVALPGEQHQSPVTR